MTRPQEERINLTLRELQKLVDKTTAEEDDTGRLVAYIILPPEYRSFACYASARSGIPVGTLDVHIGWLVKAKLMQVGNKAGNRRWIVLEGGDFRYVDLE